jgi:RNA polymerase sigma-70 factor (ECF subfamily)
VGPNSAVADVFAGPTIERPDNTSRRDATFDEVYEGYFGEVSRWIRVLGGPSQEREDLAQDVFVVVHRRLHDFDGDNLAGWLYRIAQRRVRDFRRLKWFRAALRMDAVDESTIGVDLDPEAALGSKESTLLLERMLDRLPVDQRAAFALFEIEGYSGEEIARVQAVSINTVWARIHSARRKLVRQVERLQRSSSSQGRS